MDFLRSRVDSFQTSVQNTVLDFIFLDIMEGNESCELLNNKIMQLEETSNNIGKNTEVYEKNRKIKNSDYVELKEEYMNIVFRHWLLTEKTQEVCGGEFINVLYFYRNEPECQECLDQGIILDYYRKKTDGHLLVFPFDAGIGSEPVSYLTSTFNVTEIPTIIIEGNKIDGFVSNDKMKNEICELFDFD